MDHVYLWDNGSTEYATLSQALLQQFPPEFLTLDSDERPRSQMKIFAACMEDHREEHNWMAFIDVDEYIVLRSKYALFELACTPAAAEPTSWL